MKIIAIAHNKGGTGKTTSAINIGAGLARLKKHVLLVDLDPHAHLTYSLGIDAKERPRSVYDLFTGNAAFMDIAVRRDKFMVMPANLNLSKIEVH